MAQSGAGDVLAAVPTSEKNLPVVCPVKQRDGALLCTETPTPGSSAETRGDQAQTISANSGSGRIRPGSLNRSVTASAVIGRAKR